ncbi:IRC6 [Candida margitis]|uniref:IRC6 n=1 Tax=Candida margitis TaxID=1775924 RepID=UPI0022263BFC|nr:IRC6 [Candida margitis]KAI5962863.1 IRC6 [Candida margitis]
MLPNHVLIIGPPNSGKLRMADLISKSDPASTRSGVNDDSHSGIIQMTSFSTKYYTVDLKLMIDEYPSNRNYSAYEEYIKELRDWKDEFLAEEAEELREVLDGIIFTINMNWDQSDFLPLLLNEIDDIRARVEQNGDWDGFWAVVGTVPSGESAELFKMDGIEDEVITHGFEFINMEQSGINEHRERMGRDRLLELFETHDWTNMELIRQDQNQYHDNKLNKLKEMHTGLLDENNVDLEQMFSKINLAKEKASKLPQAEREQYAKELVDEFMEFI